ncbi:UPF0496 protein [Nymphaea thermarum]|nr:UPF0496 protein [Nymphaea thermarum]
MGSQFSKRGGEPPQDIPINGNLHIASELNSYEAACQLDPTLRTFDSTLQVRTNRAINSIANGVEVRALSFDSLKEITGCLLEMNQEVVKVILECRKDIWKSQDLFDLVEEYFENSLQTLDFCTSLENCLKRARDSQLIIQVSLQQSHGTEGGWHQRTLEELRSFRDAESPFTEEFFKLFQSVYRQQVLMLEKLQARKSQLDKKLKRVKVWRRVSSIIFVAALAAVLICSVVAAAMSAPPIAAALASATSIPLGSMGKWVDSLWKRYEDAVKGQKELIHSMQTGTYIAIKDLDNIRLLIGKLENELESILQNIDFSLRENAGQDAINLRIDEIKKRLAAFMKSIEDLEQQADRCSRDILRARTVVIQRIIKNPG